MVYINNRRIGIMKSKYRALYFSGILMLVISIGGARFLDERISDTFSLIVSVIASSLLFAFILLNKKENGR